MRKLMGYEQVRHCLYQDLKLIDENTRTYIPSLVAGELFEVYRRVNELQKQLDLILDAYEGMCNESDNQEVFVHIRNAIKNRGQSVKAQTEIGSLEKERMSRKEDSSYVLK